MQYAAAPAAPRDKSKSGPDHSSTSVKTHTHLLSFSFIVNKLTKQSSAFIDGAVGLGGSFRPTSSWTSRS